MSAHDEYLAATAGVPFTKDFNDALLAVMHDELAPPGQRVLAWVKYRSWGKHREFCIRDDGRDAHQSDCAAELELHKSTISKTVSWLESRGYVRVEGKLLKPTVSPTLVPPPDQKVSDCATFEAWLEAWKVANCATFEAWDAAKKAKEVADANFKPVNLVVVSAYQRSRRAQQSGGLPTAKDLEDLKIEEEKQTDEHLPQVSVAPAPEPVRPSVSPPSPAQTHEPDTPMSVREELRDWLTERALLFGIESSLKDPVLDEIAKPLETSGAFDAFKRLVTKQRPKPESGSWKYFIPVARDVGSAIAQRPRKADDVCGLCDGDGTVMASRDGRQPKREECRACNGTGKKRKSAGSEHLETTARAKGGSP